MNLFLIYYHTSLLSNLSFLVTLCSSHGYAGIDVAEEKPNKGFFVGQTSIFTQLHLQK